MKSRITAFRNAISARLPQRRTALKWMHWTMLPLIIWFIIVTPDVALSMGGRTAFLIHSNIALFFVTLVLLWTADYMRRGLASRPGPKLPPWARHVHYWMHRVIIWGLFLIAFTGFLLGLTSSRLLKAGGFFPIAPPLDMHEANDWIGQFHIYEFYLLAVIIGGHAGFHIWRHVKLRDNALRIMMPRAFHRWL